MDKAIQTNLNGITTLTRKMKEVRDELASIHVMVEAINIDETNKDLLSLNKTVKINANRIATLRKNDFDTRIKALDNNLKTLLSTVNAVLRLADSNKSKLEQQDEAIFDINVRLKDIIKLLEENKIKIEQVDSKTQSNLGVIESIATETGQLGVKQDVIKAGLADTDEVIKGCIIGIDKNTSDLATAQGNITELAVLHMDNDSEIKENANKININSEKIALTSSQTRANSKSIETMNR